MKKRALQLFATTFLKTIVSIVLLCGIGFGSFMIVKGIFGADKKNNKDVISSGVSTESTDSTAATEEATTELAQATEEATTEEVTTEEATTEEATTEVQSVSSVGHNIEILNSTGITGLAKRWQQQLIGDGYTVSSVGNFTDDMYEETKIIVSDESLGKDLVQYFNNATITTGELPAGVDIQIIIGKSDNR